MTQPLVFGPVKHRKNKYQEDEYRRDDAGRWWVRYRCEGCWHQPARKDVPLEVTRMVDPGYEAAEKE